MAKPVIGIIGLGTMGLGIAQVFAQAGFSVRATDAQPAIRESARERLAAMLQARIAAGKLTQEICDATLARLAIVAGLSELKSCGVLIEAIVENLESKQQLFATLESIVAQDAVLATNTSSLSVQAIAKGLRHPERVLGLHFFNPAPVMKLAELVRHGTTSAVSQALARAVTEAAGKTVIACADRPGFIVNRCARPFYGEALALLEEGRPAGEIDAAMTSAGYRIGPFSLIDLIGADINLAATQSLLAAMKNHPRYHVFKALAEQVAKGDLGRKAGRGFIMAEALPPPPQDKEAIVLRIEATLANEAASLLDEGGVDEPGIEAALKLGLNFPRGPFESARKHGFPQIRAELKRLEAAAPPYLRGRYAISPALESMQ